MEKDIEFEEARGKLQFDISSTRKIQIIFFIVAAGLKFLGIVPLPYELLAILLAWFVIYFFFDWSWRKIKTTAGLYNIYFLFEAFNLLVTTAVVHYLGGAEWIGIILYFVTIVFSGLAFPRSKLMPLVALAVLLYGSLILLEGLGIIQHYALYKMEPGLYRSFSFLAPQLIVVAVSLYFIQSDIGNFVDVLRQERKKALEAYQKAKDMESVLEVKVKARTKELVDLTEKQEDIIEERTGELKKKIVELEKIQRFMVGRELKMVDLKKQIKQNGKPSEDVRYPITNIKTNGKTN